MATHETQPDASFSEDEPDPAAATIPTVGTDDARAVKPRTTTSNRWTNPALPLVEQNALPVTPRRRPKRSAPEAAAESVTPDSTPSLNEAAAAGARPRSPKPMDRLEDQAKALPASDVPVTASTSFTSSPAPANHDAPPSAQTSSNTRRTPQRGRYIAAGAVLSVAIPFAAYVALTGGLTRPSRSGVSASTQATPSDTSVAVSNAQGPERQPGLPDLARTPGQAADNSEVPATATALAAAPPAISAEIREEVLRGYGISEIDASKHVLCYLIPPSLNGTMSAANIFPTTPWFADLKRRLDRQLTQKVVNGEVTLDRAHEELKTNWVAAAHRHYVRNYGSENPDEARKIENRLNWEKPSAASGSSAP